MFWGCCWFPQASTAYLADDIQTFYTAAVVVCAGTAVALCCLAAGLVVIMKGTLPLRQMLFMLRQHTPVPDRTTDSTNSTVVIGVKRPESQLV